MIRFKLAFNDKSGERWALVLPRGPFLKKSETGEHIHSTSDTEDTRSELLGEIDLDLVEKKLNENLAAFEPQRINTRMKFGLKFAKLENEEENFTLFATTELNQTEGGILPHPSRKIYWNKDIYVYTSSLPETDKAETKFFNLSLRIGESATWEKFTFQLENLTNLSKRPDLAQYDVAAAANLQVTAGGKTLTCKPVFTIQGSQRG